VWRGAIRAEQIAWPHLIPAAEIERYQREVQGTQGWEKRRQPGYEPNEKQRRYQRACYQRKKERRQHQPATEPAERDD
jgi:hypothetical protein